jgi:hypothetical protein
MSPPRRSFTDAAREVYDEDPAALTWLRRYALNLKYLSDR